ncbi:MAG: hypothetical protein OEY38_00305 [Gammaproteobacteria bacterium]|nr:hypothetical protein [Gammaproteobacteria bacterium]
MTDSVKTNPMPLLAMKNIISYQNEKSKAMNQWEKAWFDEQRQFDAQIKNSPDTNPSTEHVVVNQIVSASPYDAIDSASIAIQTANSGVNQVASNKTVSVAIQQEFVSQTSKPTTDFPQAMRSLVVNNARPQAKPVEPTSDNQHKPLSREKNPVVLTKVEGGVLVAINDLTLETHHIQRLLQWTQLQLQRSNQKLVGLKVNQQLVFHQPSKHQTEPVNNDGSVNILY